MTRPGSSAPAQQKRLNPYRLIPRIFPYWRPYRLRVVSASLLTVLGAGFSLVEPWPLALLIDSALGDRARPSWVSSLVGDGVGSLIVFSVVVGVLLTFLANALHLLNSYVQTAFEQRMILDFRSELFAHVQRLSLTFHDTQRTGGLMYAINNQASAVGDITGMTLPLVEGVLTIVGMFLVTYAIDSSLALIALTVVPFVYVSTGIYSNRIEPRLRRARDLEGTSLSIIHEAMAMMRVIVAFGRESHEHRRFKRQGTDAVNARIDVTVRQTAFSLGVNLITAIGTALVLWVGANQVRRGELSVGQLLVVLSYIAAVYQPLEQISSAIAQLQHRLIALEASLDILDLEPEVVDSPGGIDPGRVRGRIEYDHVDFDYQGRHSTLHDITFEVQPGETVAIVGPTGAGKSTMVSLLPRLFDVKQGAIRLDGTDVRDYKLHVLRSQLSIVLQDSLLFSGSISDNIRYGRLDADRDEIETAARNANAHDFVSALPNGYDTVVGEGGSTLSGGERQRIAIARAFLRDAPILILDEPTSSIDSRTEGVILDALRRLGEGRTTLMIAHRLSTVRDADRIIVLHEGEIIEQGTHTELLQLGGLYAALSGVQDVAAARRRRILIRGRRRESAPSSGASSNGTATSELGASTANLVLETSSGTK